jgi:GTP-binding protein Era
MSTRPRKPRRDARAKVPPPDRGPGRGAGAGRARGGERRAARAPGEDEAPAPQRAPREGAAPRGERREGAAPRGERREGAAPRGERREGAAPRGERREAEPRVDRRTAGARAAEARAARPPRPIDAGRRRSRRDEVAEGPFRSGYVALVGRPNVGKSTLLNALVGQKLAATTHKPQTTRKNLLGVVELGPYAPRGLHAEGYSGAQLLFVDTPGYHRAKGPLNRFMVGEARSAMLDADVVVWMVEAREDATVTPGNQRIVDDLVRAEKRVVLALNKVDRVGDKEQILPQLATIAEALGPRLVEAVPISAVERRGLDRLVRAIAVALPEGPRYFEAGTLTDKTERELVAELIREKLMLETRDELPYSVHVGIDAFEDERPRIVRISATIVVERDSQKPIVIGRGGERLKAVGTRARQDAEFLLGAQVFLELRVKVVEGWTEDARALSRLGYAHDQSADPSDDEEDVLVMDPGAIEGDEEEGEGEPDVVDDDVTDRGQAPAEGAETHDEDEPADDEPRTDRRTVPPELAEALDETTEDLPGQPPDEDAP